MAKAAAVKWTREHFLIALNLYRKILFGRLKLPRECGQEAGNFRVKVTGRTDGPIDLAWTEWTTWTEWTGG